MCGHLAAGRIGRSMSRQSSKKSANVVKLKPVTSSRKSDVKREAIVRAATEIINQKSYALATMTEIAAALDLRDATLYYYYPDKQSLAYACHRSSLQRFENLLSEVDAAGGAGAEKLRRFICDMLVDSERNGPQLYFGDYSYLDATQRKTVQAWARRLKDVLVKFLKEGMADGSIAPCEPELVVQLVLGMLIWLAKWVDDVAGITVERLMNAIDTLCFNGLTTVTAAVPKKKGR